MENKTKEYIKTEEFVKRFPKQIHKLAILVGYHPKISYRTFRYYITKGLMPRPYILDKKSHYPDKPELYKKLFIVWYLIHFKRTGDWFKRPNYEDIEKILQSYKTDEELEYLTILIQDNDLLENITYTESVKETIKSLRKKEIKPSFKRNFLFNALLYLLRDNLNNEKIENNDVINDLKDCNSLNITQHNDIRTKKQVCIKLITEIERFKNELVKSLKELKKQEVKPCYVKPRYKVRPIPVFYPESRIFYPSRKHSNLE
jgi:hypothetical protein